MDIGDELDQSAMGFIHELTPEGAIPMGLLCVVAFMDQEGNDCWRVYCNSELTCTQNVGLLELAKMHVIRHSDLGDDD